MPRFPWACGSEKVIDVIVVGRRRSMKKDRANEQGPIFQSICFCSRLDEVQDTLLLILTKINIFKSRQDKQVQGDTGGRLPWLG